MKSSTIIWIVALLIIVGGIGLYWYSAAPVAAPTNVQVTDTNTQPLPQGDMTPTPSTPIASSTINASTSVTQ